MSTKRLNWATDALLVALAAYLLIHALRSSDAVLAAVAGVLVGLIIALALVRAMRP